MDIRLINLEFQSINFLHNKRKSSRFPAANRVFQNNLPLKYFKLFPFIQTNDESEKFQFLEFFPLPPFYYIVIESSSAESSQVKVKGRKSKTVETLESISLISFPRFYSVWLALRFFRYCFTSNNTIRTTSFVSFGGVRSKRFKLQIQLDF